MGEGGIRLVVQIDRVVPSTLLLGLGPANHSGPRSICILLRFKTQGFQFITITKEYMTALQVIQKPKSRYIRA